MKGEKLYKKYLVISNKTVRKGDKYVKSWLGKKNGKLQKTNRGWFLDGQEISSSDAQKWLEKHGERAYVKERRIKTTIPRSYKAEWEKEMKQNRQRRFKDRDADYRGKLSQSLLLKQIVE